MTELIAALQSTADALGVFADIAPILRADEAWKAATERARTAIAHAVEREAEAAELEAARVKVFALADDVLANTVALSAAIADYDALAARKP